MAFRWVAEPDDAGAAAAAGLEQQFPTRVDAEEWLTTSYEDLLEAGFSRVTLWEDDHITYGPMSLLP